MVVEQTCGSRPKAEQVKAPTYPPEIGAVSLLEETAQRGIALIGTSFSDRYQRDAYQVADAIAFSMGAVVDNYSVTGGGLTSAMEAFIRSGTLESGQYHTAIWEVPYTVTLTNISGLRQILGTLQNQGKEVELSSGTMGSDWVRVNHNINPTRTKAVRIKTPGVTSGRLELEFYNQESVKFRFNLIKSDRVTAKLRSAVWNISLTALPIDAIERLKFRIRSGAENYTIYLINW